MGKSLVSGLGRAVKRWQVLAVGLALLSLSACDDPKPKDPPPPPSEQIAEKVSAQKIASPLAQKLDSNQREALAKKSAGQPLALLDASELQLDGASALVLTFSVPLDPEQNFASLVHLVDTKSGNPDGAWELSDNLTELRFRHLLPNRKLVVTVDANLKALNGAGLGAEQQKTLETRNIEPSVGFASKGSLLPTRWAEGLPVIALNVDNVDVNFFRIKSESLPEFLADWQSRSALSSWESETLLKRADLVYTGRFALNPQLNTREHLLLPLAGIETLKQPGVYLAVMQQAGRYSYTNPATLFTLSDIGVSLHSYSQQIDVYTQGLEAGMPLADINLQLVDGKGHTLSQGKTDSQGHAKFAKDSKAVLLLAQHDGETSLINLNQSALDLAEFDIAGPQGYSKTLFAFGPRDLYRPGETLLLNALLRDADGKPVSTQPIKTQLIKPDGQVAHTFMWQPQNGLYQYQYPIPQDGPTGEWKVSFNLGDNQLRYYPFKVEDFLPERLALDLGSSKQPLAIDAEVKFDVTGRYLYGAPAAGNRLQGQVYLRPLREAVSALPDYEFGVVNEENLSRTLSDIDQTLDAEGKGEVSIENSWNSVHSPLTVILQASLLESGGRPVTRRVDQAIWPAEVLPGIRPLFNKQDIYDYRTDKTVSQAIVNENTQADFDIVSANAEGQKLAAKGLEVRLVRERRDYYWQWSESDGWQSLYDKKDLVLARQQIDIAADGSTKVSFPVEWGAYRIEVEDPQTHQVSSLRFWAGYSWQDNTDGTDAVRPDQVKLKLDKPAYQPGERAKIHIQAPAAGKGYLLVESSDGPLWWQEINVPEAGIDVDVPINSEWRRHDLYFSALVLRPGDKKQQSTPKRAVGLLHLPLVTEGRKLNLQLQAPAKIRPNQLLTVKVKATVEGKAVPHHINLLLSAVDAGVLSITRFKTPDPYDAFLGRKRYSVDQYDVYGYLIEGKGRMASLSFGGDGDEDPLSRGGQKPVTEVTIVAQQAMPVTLDDNGEGEVQIPIPDFNGELRLMAQGWSDEDFGSAESKVVVAAPVIADLATPRFMADNDTAALALDVTNLSGAEQTLSLSVATSGLISLNGSISDQRVVLAQGQRKTISIPVKALAGFGKGQVSLTVSGMNLPNEKLPDYHRSWAIGVRPAFPALTRNFATVLHLGETWQLPPDANAQLEQDTLQGRLLLSSKPPLNLARYISELLAYPYGCLEQTTSGLYPSLYTSRAQLAAMGIKTSTDDIRRHNIDIGIDRLFGMQKDSGGFGLWSKDSPEEFWLTAYATDFLVRASQQGYSVSNDGLDKANKRLQRYLQDPNQIDVRYSSQPDSTRFAVQAYAGLVLAGQQQAPLGALRQLYEKRSAAQSGLPLVQLGIALKMMGDMPRAETALAEGVAKVRPEKNYWLEDYGSPLRDNALILSLLTENNLLPEVRDRLLLSLSASLNGQRWLSTQESNALFMAGRGLINSAEAPWQVNLGGDSQAIAGTVAVTRGFDAIHLKQPVILKNSGDAAVYTRFDVTGYPLQAPTESSSVLHIKRNYLGMDGQPLSLASLKSGDLVVVHLDVWADSHVPDALVVDLLPAGLELENQNLADSSASLGDSASKLTELMTDMQQADIKHQEYRDDRYVAAIDVDGYRHVALLYLARAVTPGSYAVPAPQVESMYVPAWRATGQTSEKMNVR
ncbi:alpha-2-macroglobulin [Serratia sp. M24T3]|uniref:alpha-2-macroglobulin family protein n=1 Tax=Serratia sp. M24T3 TaxID=932213 RepID=UPI00025BA539|nr:alpha-2-macroglobulin [Serratia sp. M24T3]EIC82492.1 alpha-2-macroglobulin domain-containing protein [Serratia sp. M24T3]